MKYIKLINNKLTRGGEGAINFYNINNDYEKQV